MGPLPDTWWRHRIQRAMTWVFATWEMIHYDLGNRGRLLFWMPKQPSLGWNNYWSRQTPENYLIQNYAHRHYHVGWFIWHVCERVERLWKRW